MPRKTLHLVGGQVVTAADIRRWCQAVAPRVSETRRWQYVREYRVIEKIAAHKAAGVFEETLRQAAERAGVKVRAPRTPGVLTRVRALPACNEPRFSGP